MIFEQEGLERTEKGNSQIRFLRCLLFNFPFNTDFFDDLAVDVNEGFLASLMK